MASPEDDVREPTTPDAPEFVFAAIGVVAGALLSVFLGCEASWFQQVAACDSPGSALMCFAGFLVFVGFYLSCYGLIGSEIQRLRMLEKSSSKNVIPRPHFVDRSQGKIRGFTRRATVFLLVAQLCVLAYLLQPNTAGAGRPGWHLVVGFAAILVFCHIEFSKALQRAFWRHGRREVAPHG